MVRTYDLLRSPTADTADGTVTLTGVAEVPSMQHVDTPGAGTWRYWARTDDDGVKSSWAGPATATVDGASEIVTVDTARLDAAPTTGTAWTYLLDYADRAVISPSTVNSYDHEPTSRVMAAAYAYYKTSTQAYKDKVVTYCRDIIGSENIQQSSPVASQSAGEYLLATMRVLPAYIIAADVVGMDRTVTGTRVGETSRTWESWLLDRVLYRAFADPIGTHGRWKTPLNTLTSAASNWGAQAVQTCAAISVYTGETVERDKIVRIVRGHLGDQSATGHPTYPEGATPPNTNTNNGAGFRTTSSFMSDMAADYVNAENGWMPINPPAGAIVDDVRKDGVCVEDASRTSQATFNAWVTSGSQDTGHSYTYEYLNGLLAGVAILQNAGYSLTGLGTSSILRAYDFMDRNGFVPAENTGRWGVPFWVNRFYSQSYTTPAGMSSSTGTHYGHNASHYWDWLYG